MRLGNHESKIEILRIRGDHPAFEEARTIYPATVVDPDGTVSALKRGGDQTKLGAEVMKGAWRGARIYSLALEERATCPRTCELWRDCYGNSMGRVKRLRAGPTLEAALGLELQRLSKQHEKFAVRLHVLGDFYSERYVALWEMWLRWYPQLHLFGFTHWKPYTKIGGAIAVMNERHRERCVIKFSGLDAVTFRNEAPPGAIHCPAQTGQTRGCDTCALCWSHAVTKPIAFQLHGRLVAGP